MSDWKKDYWAECISNAAEECELSLSSQQLECLVDAVNGGHENYGMASGHDVASANLMALHDRVIFDLKKSVERERSKIICLECNGTGSISSEGTAYYARSSCWKCHGEGRHDP